MSPDDSDDFFRPPNDNAYETEQIRTGPPLDYVAEKFRHNLEALHSLIHEIRRRVPKDLCAEERSWGPPVSVKEEYLFPTAHYAFRSAIVGYLALNNMLALANETDLDDRLLACSPDEFKEWLGACPSNETRLHQRVLSCSKTGYRMPKVPLECRPSNENRITRTGS